MLYLIVRIDNLAEQPLNLSSSVAPQPDPTRISDRNPEEAERNRDVATIAESRGGLRAEADLRFEARTCWRRGWTTLAVGEVCHEVAVSLDAVVAVCRVAVVVAAYRDEVVGGVAAGDVREIVARCGMCWN